MMVQINQSAPDFCEDAYIDDELRKVSLADYKGKWVVLFFYPGDFTFVCPTELGELADIYDEIKKMDTEIISVSTDSAFVHKAWHDTSPTINKIRYPMLADTARRVCHAFGTLIEQEGVSLRATFIIDPQGMIKAYEFHDNGIGRSAEELMRKLAALRYVSMNKGQVCPVNWKPGIAAIVPGLGLVGKL